VIGLIVHGSRLQFIERAKRMMLVVAPFTFRDDDMIAADCFEEMGHSDKVSNPLSGS
jgi:hypothetical protein